MECPLVCPVPWYVRQSWDSSSESVPDAASTPSWDVAPKAKLTWRNDPQGGIQER
jgi:hypothetical protein